MLLGDAWHWISVVGSKGDLKGMEKIVCRELLDWGTLAALCRQAEAGTAEWHRGLGIGQIAPAGCEMYGWCLVSFTFPSLSTRERKVLDV